MVSLRSFVYPGAGYQGNFTVADQSGAAQNIANWTVTATLEDPTGAQIATVSCVQLDSYTFQAQLPGAQTALLAGQRVTLRVVGVPPASLFPVVQEADLIIGTR